MCDLRRSDRVRAPVRVCGVSRSEKRETVDMRGNGYSLRSFIAADLPSADLTGAILMGGSLSDATGYEPWRDAQGPGATTDQEAS